MREEPLDFMQFNVIYVRQGKSNKWTRRIERKTDPVKTGAKGIVTLSKVHWEGETIKDEKRVNYVVNVKCDPLFNDPNTITIPEDWRYYEEDALKLTDKEFKKRHPEAEYPLAHALNVALRGSERLCYPFYILERSYTF